MSAVCRSCGCTDDHACVGPDGPCGWAAPDLCTSCVQAPIVAQELLREIEEVAQLSSRGWLIETGGGPLTAEQQAAHDLGVSAGCEATIEVFQRHGLMHTDGGQHTEDDPNLVELLRRLVVDNATTCEDPKQCACSTAAATRALWARGVQV